MINFDRKLFSNKILIVSDYDDSYTKKEYDAEQKFLKKILFQMRKYNADVEYHEVETSSDLRKLLKKYDNEKTIVFNWCERLNQVDGSETKVTKIYEDLGFTFTGPGTKTLKLIADKYLTKNILRRNGINVPRTAFVKYSQVGTVDAFMGGPCIVKSNKLHASAGMTQDNVCHSYNQYYKVASRMAEELETDLVVEEFIKGREYCVVVWGNDSPQMLPILKLKWPIDDEYFIYSEAAKFDVKSKDYKVWSFNFLSYKNHEDFYKLVQDVVLPAYKALGLVDYARFDIRFDGENVYIIDSNANPYINDALGLSEVLWSTQKIGYNFGETILKVCEHAYKRKQKR